MKGKRHSPEQIIVKLREADALLSTGATLGQVCQKLAVSGAYVVDSAAQSAPVEVKGGAS